MKKLIIFSDMEGTINRATTDDFINLFDLVDKYCEKCGYDQFSFNVVTGAWDDCRALYRDIFLFIKNKTGRTVEHKVYTRLSPEEKREVIDSVVSCEAIPKNYEDEIPDDIPFAEEVIFFDDAPHESLKGDTGKEFFESKYDISFKCVIPTRNINSLLDYFSQQLACDDQKAPYVKSNS